MKPLPKNYVEERPRIGVSKQFMVDMTRMIRGQFCPDWDDRTWNMHLWLVQRVVTYPAAWLNKRAIFVGPERYRALLLELLQEVKANAGRAERMPDGQIKHAAEIKFPPGYLLKCVQEHMRFNADRYNAEGKAARDGLARVLATFPTAEARPDYLVKTLAAGVAAIQKPTRRRSTTAEKQGTLGL